MNRLFVDNITVIDFAFLDPERGLVGESWIVDVELEGELDEQGMVFDFGFVKPAIKRVIDETVDHRLLVPVQAPCFRQVDETTLEWHQDNGQWLRHSAPTEAVTPIQAPAVTRAAVARLLEQALRRVLPGNVQAVHLNLRVEPIEGAYYHYVHGLRKHQGNCQRIAHGHRSRLVIEQDGERAPGLERQWAERWRDIYIGTRDDLADRYQQAGQDTLCFRYLAAQGEFELHLPEARVYLIDTDSTVEWIACHLAEQCKTVAPESRFRVRAFEGVGKGAVAER